jgi:ribosomal protein S18 acetylase RimI-like enzyme
VEGAPRPLELLFDAINAGTLGDVALPHPPADEWPAVTEARRAERLAPPRPYRRAPQGEAVVCEVCGFGYENAGGDRLRHRAYHDRAVNGVRVPLAVRRTLRHVASPGPLLAEDTADGAVCDGVLVVRPTSPVALRRLAYALSVLLKREQHYDFPSIPYPRRRRWDDAEDEDRTRYQAAYLVAIRPARGELGELGEPGTPGAPPAPEERAVGLLVLRRRPHGGWWDADARTHTPASAGVEGWAIEVVYVAPAWRRRGIGSQLTEAAARLRGVRPSELLHSMPLSEGGLALACATAGTRTLLVAG